VLSAFSCSSGLTLEYLDDEETEQTETPPKNDGLLHIVSDGYSEFNITYSERADSDTVAIAQALSHSIFAKTGVELRVKSDYVSRVEDIKEETPEILIGLTNRKSSVELNKKTESLRFALKITDTKVVIVGKSIEAIKTGVDFFCENYLGMGAVTLGNGEWSIETGIEYIGEPLPDNVKNLMGERIDLIATEKKLFGMGEKILGGCVNEDHYYSFVRLAGEDYRIVKYDMKDMSIEKVGTEIYIGDSLDLEYDAKLFKIAVINSSTDLKKISYINTGDLTSSSFASSKVRIKFAAYYADGTYAVIDADTGELVLLNEKLREESRYGVSLTEVNGITCDDRFIYILGRLDGETVIAAYTKGGDLVNKIKLELDGKTPTNIEEYKGKLLIAVNDPQNGGELYEFKVEVK